MNKTRINAKEAGYNEKLLNIPEVKKRSVERAVNRYKDYFIDTVFADSKLEGLTFTKPQIKTILEYGILRGSDKLEVDLVKCLSDGLKFVEKKAKSGPHKFNIYDAKKLNKILDEYESLDPGVIRDVSNIGGDTGLVDVAGKFEFKAPTENLSEIIQSGIKQTNSIPNVIVAAAFWQGFSAYYQPFLNGNKRTSRYLANLVLLSNGYDAVLIPADKQKENDFYLEDLYKNGDMTKYMNFLLSLYTHK